eukprot:UN24917
MKKSWQVSNQNCGGKKRKSYLPNLDRYSRRVTVVKLPASAQT